MDKYRVYAGIDIGALRHNMESMHGSINENTKIAAVIKTDAYGHGALTVARAIEDFYYLWGYAVATADEALSLIADGRRKPVLILGISFEEQYADIIENGIRPTVCGARAAEKLSEIAVGLGKTCKIHIKVDTGMNRIGFPANKDSADAIAKIAALPGIEIEGIFTHFARADEASKEPVKIQIDKFMDMKKMLGERGVSIPIWHCSNSAGIVEIPEANFDMVRAGITLYGMWPSDDVKRVIDLKPVMSLHSHVSFLKTLDRGEPISYGGTYVTEGRRLIATVPVGYGDGYARSLSNVGSVLIRGQRAKICGRVCMDQMMVDVTDIPRVCEGDAVTLLGADGGDSITMEELGALSGRFNYEFSCLITPRVPRVYFE